jgi:hypothetical protein
VAATLGKLYDVELVTFADADTFDWSALPQDGRFTILASTSRLRYGPHARATWKPDLHLALWNPYQALDIAAPALMTYGFAAPALDAVNAWLSGDAGSARLLPGTRLRITTTQEEDAADGHDNAKRNPLDLGTNPVLRAGPAFLFGGADRQPDVEEHGRAQ